MEEEEPHDDKRLLPAVKETDYSRPAAGRGGPTDPWPVERLLEEAGTLHEAALDPARWLEVARVVRQRMTRDVQTQTLSPEQAAWLDAMIDSASRVAAEVARLHLARSTAHAAQDALTVGILVVDRDGRVLRANPQAERLLRGSSWAAAASGAGTPRSRLPAPFDTLSAAAPTVIRLARTARPALEVLAVPVESIDDPLGLAEARTLLLLVDPDAVQGPSAATLIETFGLTPAEARLATRLLHGDTPLEASAALGVAMPTIRTHLRNLLAKSGAARQQDLLRILLSVPAAADR